MAKVQEKIFLAPEHKPVEKRRSQFRAPLLIMRSQSEVAQTILLAPPFQSVCLTVSM
jgi:hypothetical protein